MLSKHRHVIKEDLLKTLTENLVLSHLTYSLPVWGPSLSKYSLQRIKYLQNRAVRLCRGLHKYDHVSHHYCSLNWLPFESLVQYRSLCAMYKLYRVQHLPLQPPIVFGCTHLHNTRTKLHFAQPAYCHLSFALRHFRFKSISWWNSLPEEMIAAGNFPAELFSNLLNNLTYV